MRRLLFAVVVLSLLIPDMESIYNSCRRLAYAQQIPIECNGDQVEYFEKEKKIVGSGNIVITYKDMKLTCDKVIVWTETKEAEAEGNVKLFQGENVFEGDRMKYNLENSTGEIVNFKATSVPWYAKGKEAKRLSEEKFLVRKGYVTTCDHERPHWRLSANRVYVYPKNRIETYNAFAWLNPFSLPFDIPVFWVPWYCHPLDDNKPHVTVIPGKNAQWGMYLLTAWRYNLTPGQKGYVRVDYRERKDLAVGLDYIYDSKIFGNGVVNTYYTNERDLKRKHSWHKWYKTEKNDNTPTPEEEKGLLRIRHQWEVNQNTLVTAEMHKYKDENFLKDYFYNEYEKDEHPRSYVLLTNTTGYCNFSLLTEKRANRFDTVLEKLPEAKFNIDNLPVSKLYKGAGYTESEEVYGSGAGNFYYTGNFSAANLNQVYPRHTDENPGTIQDPEHNNVYDTYNKLSYKTKLGFLKVTPYAGIRETYFSREIDTDAPQIMGAFCSGVDVSTKFFRVFEAKGYPLGMEINRLRHIITPTLSYNFVSDPTVSPSKVFGASIARSSVMGLGLENKLQTKRGKDLNTVDLAMLLINTSYDFSHTPGTQFLDYTTKLELRPFDWLLATSDAIMDPHKRSGHEWLKQMNNNLSFSFGNKCSFGVGHNYTPESTAMNFGAKLNFIPGWKFSVYEEFNVLGDFHGTKKRWDLKEQQYVVTKDLHCWDMDIRYNVRREAGEEIFVVFRLKAFPEIPFEFGKEYHTPKMGSQTWEKY